MIKLSVIVPVYNVENYIEECINSLVSQTMKEMEIIIVDDGSKDSSIEIVKKFKDERLRIIHKSNGGLSSARNYGLKYAKGEYVAFVDSDDFIKNSTSFEEMYNLGVENGADIIVGNSEWYYSSNNIVPYKRDREIFYSGNTMSGEDYIIEFMNKCCMLRTVWTSIYKRKLLLDNKIEFMVGILHEDELFTPQVFLAAKKVTIYSKGFYMYRQREGSIMNSGKNMKMCNDMLFVCKELSKINQNISNNCLREVLGNHISSLIYLTIYKYRLSYIDEDYIKIVKENSFSRSLKRKSRVLRRDTGLFIIYEKICRAKNRIENKIKKIIGINSVLVRG